MHLEGELSKLKEELEKANKLLEARDRQNQRTSTRMTKMRDRLLKERNHIQVMKSGYGQGHQPITDVETEVYAGLRVWHNKRGLGVVDSIDLASVRSKPYTVKFGEGDCVDAHEYSAVSMLKFFIVPDSHRKAVEAEAALEAWRQTPSTELEVCAAKVCLRRLSEGN